MKVLHVVGARPNYMKTAPIMAELATYPAQFAQVLVHTGQHYDYNMSKVFFEELGISPPDEYLNVGSGTHAEQTARIMLAFEPIALKYKPDCVIVVGDVNSTLACALVCAKLGIALVHVEAGLRSRDWTMPEEVNRVLTDRMSSLLFTPSREAGNNLLLEGIPPHKIHFVGNVMIDTLVKMLPKTDHRSIIHQMGLDRKRYVLVTLHRPANVDSPEALREVVSALGTISRQYPVVFPIHPRTRQRLEQYGLLSSDPQFYWLDPLGYLDFLTLTRFAGAVITDSGGVQEETTYLGIPCLTVRPNTERPITIEIGTNQLVRTERDALITSLEAVLHGDFRVGQIPEKWDGMAARRIVEVMRSGV